MIMLNRKKFCYTHHFNFISQSYCGHKIYAYSQIFVAKAFLFPSTHHTLRIRAQLHLKNESNFFYHFFFNTQNIYLSKDFISSKLDAVIEYCNYLIH